MVTGISSPNCIQVGSVFVRHTPRGVVLQVPPEVDSDCLTEVFQTYLPPGALIPSGGSWFNPSTGFDVLIIEPVSE